MTDYGESSVSAVGDQSRGRLPLTIDAKFLADTSEAQAMADALLAFRETAYGEVTELVITPRKSTTLMQIAEEVTLMDRITVSETQTGVSGDFFVMTEKVELDNGGSDYKVTYTLQPADGFQAWILGDSVYGKLGETTILGY